MFGVLVIKQGFADLAREAHIQKLAKQRLACAMVTGGRIHWFFGLEWCDAPDKSRCWGLVVGHCWSLLPCFKVVVGSQNEVQVVVVVHVWVLKAPLCIPSSQRVQQNVVARPLTSTFSLLDESSLPKVQARNCRIASLWQRLGGVEAENCGLLYCTGPSLNLQQQASTVSDIYIEHGWKHVLVLPMYTTYIHTCSSEPKTWDSPYLVWFCFTGVSKIIDPHSGLIAPEILGSSLLISRVIFQLEDHGRMIGTLINNGMSLPVVPRKTVAEVSKIGNLYERFVIHWWTERWLELCFLEWLRWLRWSPRPRLLDVVWCSTAVVVVVV